MTDIILNANNSTYIKVTCSESIGAELRDYFTFQAPNHKFHPMYRKKHWNGKIRLYNNHTKKIYRGLLPYIQQFAEQQKYTLDIKDNLDVANEISLFEIQKFIDKLNLHSGGEKLTIRDYQLKYISHVLRRKRALILSPTSSGKSLNIYILVRFFQRMGLKKGLLVVPTINLVSQMFNDFRDYSSHNGWVTLNNCHTIYEGQSKTSDKHLYISTWHSIHTLPQSYFDEFDYIIFDEAHGASAKCVKGIGEKCTKTKFRIGLTGTLDGTDTHQLVLEGLFGPVIQEITTKELIDRKEAANFEIKCISLKYPTTVCSSNFNMTYDQEKDFLIGCERRNKFIRNLALSLDKNTLILYRYVEKHGKILFDMLQQANMDCNRKIYFISGNTDMEVRDSIRGIVENETDAIIVASMGTYSTGVNIKNLHYIIMAAPNKGKIKLLQSIGRSLRLHHTKDKAILFDIVDDMVHQDKPNYSVKHFIERVKIYHEEQFPYKFYKVALN